MGSSFSVRQAMAKLGSSLYSKQFTSKFDSSVYSTIQNFEIGFRSWGSKPFNWAKFPSVRTIHNGQIRFTFGIQNNSRYVKVNICLTHASGWASWWACPRWESRARRGPCSTRGRCCGPPTSQPKGNSIYIVLNYITSQIALCILH